MVRANVFITSYAITALLTPYFRPQNLHYCQMLFGSRGGLSLLTCTKCLKSHSKPECFDHIDDAEKRRDEIRQQILRAERQAQEKLEEQQRKLALRVEMSKSEIPLEQVLACLSVAG